MSIWKIQPGANTTIPDFTIYIPPSRSGINRKVIILQMAEGTAAVFLSPTVNGALASGASAPGGTGNTTYKVSWWDESNLPSTGGDYTVSGCGGSSGTYAGDMAASAFSFERANTGSPGLSSSAWAAGAANGTNSSVSGGSPLATIFFALDPDNSTMTLWSGSHAAARLISAANGASTAFAVGLVQNPSPTTVRSFGFTKTNTTTDTLLGWCTLTSSGNAFDTFRAVRPLSATGPSSSSAKATALTRNRGYAAKLATSTSVTADLTTTPAAGGSKTFSTKVATSTSAKASQSTTRPVVAKSATASSAKATKLNQTKVLVAKGATATSAKASQSTARPITAKAATSSSAKATKLTQSKVLAAKAATSVGAKASSSTSRPIAAKSATSDGAKALRVSEAKRFTAKAATSSSAKATKILRSAACVAKASIAANAKLLLGTGTLTQVQKVQAANVTSTTITSTFASTPTVGNVLISALGVGPTAVTVTAPSGWTIVAQENTHRAGQRAMALAYKVAGASEPTTVTWTVNTSVNLDAIAFEYSGLDTTVDQVVTAYQSDNASFAFLDIGPTGTTDSAKELAVVACVIPNTRTSEAFTNGFTRETASGSRSLVGTLTTSATGTLATTASWSGANGDSAGTISTFRVTVAGELFRVTRPITAKGGTASSTKALLDAGDPHSKSFLAKAATANGAKALRIARAASLVAKAANATSAKASMRTTRSITAKVQTSSSSKALRIVRARPVAAKAATAAGTTSSARISRPFIAKAATSSSTKGSLVEAKHFIAKAPTASSTKALRINRERPITVKAATSSGAKALRISETKRFLAKLGTSSSAKALRAAEAKRYRAKTATSSGAKASLSLHITASWTQGSNLVSGVVSSIPPIVVALSPATAVFSARALTLSISATTRALNPSTANFSARTVTPVQAGVTRTLVSATTHFNAQILVLSRGAVSRSVSAATASFHAQVLTPSIVVAKLISPATANFSARAVGTVQGGVTPPLVAAIVTVSARTLTPVVGHVSSTILPASATFTAGTVITLVILLGPPVVFVTASSTKVSRVPGWDEATVDFGVDRPVNAYAIRIGGTGPFDGELAELWEGGSSVGPFVGHVNGSHLLHGSNVVNVYARSLNGEWSGTLSPRSNRARRNEEVEAGARDREVVGV